MKICFLSHSAVHPRQFWFYETFAKLGHSVLVLAPHKWGANSLVAYKLSDCNYECKTYNCLNAGDLFYYTYPHLALADLSDFKPDVIHIQNELRCRQTKLTRDWALDLGAKFTVFCFENIFAPTEEDRKVVKTSNLIIVGNQDAFQLVNAFAPKKRTLIFPQAGINTQVFRKQDENVNYHLCFAGRLVPEKGIDMVKRIGTELGIKVLWVSGQSYFDVPKAMSQCLLFVYPPFRTAYWKEQCGYSALEAMACGIPVVATRCGSLPEYLGEAALFADEHDAEKLKYNIELLLGDADLRLHQIELGYNLIQDKYTNEIVAKQYIKEFERL